MSDPSLPDRFKDLLAQLCDELKARGYVLPDLPALPDLGGGDQWRSFGRFWRGGWRSSAGWVVVLILFVNGVILPIARLFGFAGEGMDWKALAALVIALPALAHYRSADLQAGKTT
ncbi:MAG: hypothetical protein Q8K93_17595 [Reyranella sp.]|uniref:hypothetical protein n=1 Tax=Reyranella sp. TaxID=1929291 RepID=UPI0027306817|nr:hypothetical protein [Reyranella sp.]MDP1964005.1 hypothetical protein [Reyranella sp.]MDP2376548.1 hypothetical protein [Reyranella sp.]